ncbi:hypothetical protein BH09ACT11_BH09ACT11_13700 [soil metagenome]
MNTIRTIRTISAAGAATVVLIGAALLSSNAAQADSNSAAAPPRMAQKSVTNNCQGGAAVSMSTRTMDYQSIPGGTTAEIEGSQWSAKGPKKGSDAVLVTFTALTSPGDSSVSYLRLYKDGVGTSEGPKYVAFGSAYLPAAVTFCTKIGKGIHSLDLRAVDNSSSGPTYLYKPTVTYQRFK